MKVRGRIAVKLALVLSLVSGVVGGLAVKYADQWPGVSTYAATVAEAQLAKQQLSGEIKHARGLSEAFTSVAKAVRPSVVNISSVTRVTPASGKSRVRPEIPDELRERFGGDDFFDRFFEDQLPTRPYAQRGQGTGFIVSNDGFIVTNNHVVRGASELTVRLSDGREFVGKVVGQDDKTDVAVIKIDAKDLMPVELGNSDEMEVGQWVLAIGSPFGLEQTVTAGIISAKGRANVGILDYEDFLQTDAAINPGNSGGPLVNMEGKVVGVNTAIASRGGGYNGVGFAIPSNMIKLISESLMRDGKVTRGWLGAAIQDLNEGLAQSFNYKSTAGVLVGDVVPASPAAKAGLKSGDIVTSLNGKGMTSAAQLRHAIAATQPKTKVELSVFRDGKPVTVSVTVGELDAGATLAAKGESTEEAEAKTDELGITVQNITPQIAQQLKLKDATEGVVITAVEDASLAAEAGIEPGDVISKVGGQAVKSADDYRRAVEKHPLAQGVRIQVSRDGVSRFVFLKSNR
jgi:serine protease Do